ncbi:MAG: hypothetical protein ACFFEM_02495 [Candidatus Thorarchaeota archaeon]
MDIPVLTNFVDGLKLFFSSRRLRWLTLLFFVAALTITILERIVYLTYLVGTPVVVIGAIFPTFFMLAAFVSLLGLARFVVDDESYMRSLIYTAVWAVISIIVLVLMVTFTPGLLAFLFIGVAFLGWIGFQSFFSTRTALGFAESVVIEDRSAIVRFLYMAIYFFNYIIVVGSFIFTIVFVNPPVFLTATFWFAALGMLFAMGFNFLNGWILIAERNKSTASNISFLGLFISLYSAYFIYNLLQGFNASIDLVSIGISIFFILYTMSSVGRTLASRAELETRWKVSKEFAATFTYFLATGFMYVDALFTSIVTDAGAIALAGTAGDIVKLVVFPFVALVMELNFIRKSRKTLEIKDTPTEVPELYDEPAASEEEPAVLGEPTDEDDALTVPEDEEVEDLQDVADEEDVLEEYYATDEEEYSEDDYESE